MNKKMVVKKLLPSTPWQNRSEGIGFAPSNIALCKYWGKRQLELNLPATPSLSISLGDKGAHCRIELSQERHRVFVNQQPLPHNHVYTQQLSAYLSLFDHFYNIHLDFNIPVAAGLASSACSFAALVKALNDLHQWQLDLTTLSILARLGSGSACRSLWDGFVKWEMGGDEAGLDSHGVVMEETWESLCVGLLIISNQKKPISSREAMLCTQKTSHFYPVWPEKVAKDLSLIEKAIQTKDFKLLGETAESNALSLHAMMMASTPPIVYALPETINQMHQVWRLRASGLSVYFTQDAGPNLKLLFSDDKTTILKNTFPNLVIIKPFCKPHA